MSDDDRKRNAETASVRAFARMLAALDRARRGNPRARRWGKGRRVR